MSSVRSCDERKLGGDGANRFGNPFDSEGTDAVENGMGAARGAYGSEKGAKFGGGPESFWVNGAGSQERIVTQGAGFLKVDHVDLDAAGASGASDEIAHVAVIVHEPGVDGDHFEQVRAVDDAIRLPESWLKPRANISVGLRYAFDGGVKTVTESPHVRCGGEQAREFGEAAAGDFRKSGWAIAPLNVISFAVGPDGDLWPRTVNLAKFALYGFFNGNEFDQVL